MQEKIRPNYDPNAGSNNNKSKVTVKRPDIGALVDKAKKAVQESKDKNSSKGKVKSYGTITYGERCGC